MKKLMTICLLAIASLLGTSAQSIYDVKVKNDVEQDVSLSDYKGKVLLIVNTATRCGFTPQYKELETLYEKYHAEGLEILDFPCNQFGEQAPGTIQEIHQFCTANFDIQFPQFDKIDVNGTNESPLYTYLKSQKGFSGFDLNDKTGKFMDEMLRKQDADYEKKSDIKWNFTKFLVSRDGRVVKRYEPTDKISDIEADVTRELNPVLSSIMTRTSIRKYTDQPVSKADIETLLRAGMAAPTAVNRQPWHFVAVTDKAKLKELAGSRGRMIEQCAVLSWFAVIWTRPCKAKVRPIGFRTALPQQRTSCWQPMPSDLVLYGRVSIPWTIVWLMSQRLSNCQRPSFHSASSLLAILQRVPHQRISGSQRTYRITSLAERQSNI